MTATPTFAWDGLTAGDVGARLDLPSVWIYSEVGSTQDIAHELAEQGAPAGALVVADAQRTGRGRHGRSWASQPGQGVWCTVVERPSDPGALEVLSLRIGMRLAAALDEFAGQRIRLKWPNDLVIPSNSAGSPSNSAVIPSNSAVIPSNSAVIPSNSAVIPSAARDLHLRKLAGILTEARWSGSSLAWVAVGVGVNVAQPAMEGAAWLLPGTPRLEVLRAVVHAVRGAAKSQGPFTETEIERFGERDALAGKRIVSPGAGVVQGIDASGALLVRDDNGVTSYRSGTVQLENAS